MPAADAPDAEWRAFTASLAQYVDARFAGVSDDVTALRRELADGREQDRQAIAQEFEQFKAHVGVETTRAALEGVGIAAGGSLLVLVGSLITAVA